MTKQARNKNGPGRWARRNPAGEITHHGRSNITGAPYRFTALGIIRVCDGEIVRYDDYMDPIALARLLGRTRELATALSAS